MPRVNLTEEEARHIEQRRDSERRFALGYNQALLDLGKFLAEIEAEEGLNNAILESISVRTLEEWQRYSRKEIRK